MRLNATITGTSVSHLVQKRPNRKRKKKWEKTKQRPWNRPIIVGKFIVYEEIVQCSLMAGWLWLKGGGGGDGGGDGGINDDYR